MATGVTSFARVPEILRGLPPELSSHSSEHSDLESFRGRSVAVVGAGASALDLATLLHEAGADVQLVARSSTIRFHDPPSKPSLRGRLMRPDNSDWAGLAHALFRSRASPVPPVAGECSPGANAKDPWSGAWVVRQGSDRRKNTVPSWRRDHRGENARWPGESRIERWGRTCRAIEVDHVIAATGYKVETGPFRLP